MGYLKSIGTIIIYIGLFLAVITFLPNLPPQAEFSEYSIKAPSDVQHKLHLQNRLRNAEVQFSGELKGPEYFASYNGELYTGVRGGYVVKIEKKQIVPIVKFGKKCDGLWQEEKCGRPLGMKFNDKGELFVADAYYGIFKVNVNTRQYTSLFNISEPIDGKAPRLFNSLDIAKNGDIYWTDSTTDFPLHDGVYSFLANPSGRLIRYNAATKKNEVLVRHLGFANGVVLSDDESFVIALECLTSRIVKYNLKGPKAGQHEMFLEALPGLPDNVHTDEQGGFLVSLVLYIDSEYPFLPQSLMPHPYLRKMFARLLYSIEAPFKLLQDIYPNYYAERVLHSVGTFDASPGLDAKKTSVVLRIDKAGNVIDAIYSDDGKVHSISSAYIHNGYLWLGSPYNEYLMTVPLKEAFPQLSSGKKTSSTREQNKEEPSVIAAKVPNVKIETKPVNAKLNIQKTATTPKPTTTTPKPTTASPTPTTTTPKPTATTPKPTTTTSKPTTAAPKPTTTTQKPITQKPVTAQTRPSTTTPKPSSPSAPKVSKKEMEKDNSKEAKEENLKRAKTENFKEIKKESVKDIKEENLKKMKKENSNSNIDTKAQNVKTASSKKRSEETVNSKSDEIAKKNVRETKFDKVKPVEKEGDSTKK